jgi:hypothetical protein
VLRFRPDERFLTVYGGPDITDDDGSEDGGDDNVTQDVDEVTEQAATTAGDQDGYADAT